MDTVIDPEEHPRRRAVEPGTGADRAEWPPRPDAAGARELDHAAIARLVHTEHGVDEWWAQGVTVAYEQIIGRRQVGQSCEGDFAASASRTLDGDMDRVLGDWTAFMTAERRAELTLGEPAVTTTEKWRYWRARAEDGSRASINISAKDGSGADARSTLAVEHKGLEDADQRAAWKTAWTRTLTAFKETR